MKKYIPLFFFLAIPVFLSAVPPQKQPPENHFVDSLKHELEKQRDDTARLQYALKIIARLKAQNTVQAEYFHDLALQQAKKMNWELGLAKVHSSGAIIESGKGNYEEALELYYKALEVFEKENNKREIARVLNNMAKIYSDTKQLRKAKGLLERAKDVYLNIGNQKGSMHAYLNLGNISSDLHQYDTAFFYFDNALSLAREISYTPVLILIHLNKSKIFTEQKKYVQAHIQIDSALQLATAFKAPYFLVIVHTSKAQTLVEEKKGREALSYLSSAEDFNQQLESLENKMIIADLRTRAYILEGNPEEAFRAQETYRLLKDSLSGVKIRKDSELLAHRYQNEKAQMALRLLDQENNIQKLKIQRRNLLAGLLGFLVLTSGAAGYIMYRNMRLKHKQEMFFLEQKALRAQINPHFLFNALNSIQMFVSRNDPNQAMEYLSKFSRLMRLILENSENTSISLKNELEAVKLYMEIEKLRTPKPFGYNIVVDKTIDPLASKIPSMILQPFVENAIWHGFKDAEKECKITIHCQARDKHLEIRITDNGIGVTKSGKAITSAEEGVTHTVSGTSLVAERFNVISRFLGKKYHMKIEELTDDNQEIVGTEVSLSIPT